MNAEILRTKGSQLIQNLERSARRTSKSLIQLAVLAGVVGYAFLGGGVNSASADGVCSGVESFSSSTNEARFVMDADCAAVNVAGIANKYGFPAFDLTNRMFKNTNINSWDLIWKDTDGSPFEIIMRNEVDGSLVVNVPGGNPLTFTPQQFADLLTEYSVSADGLPSSVPVGEATTDQAAVTVPSYPTATPGPTAIYPAPAGVWVGGNFESGSESPTTITVPSKREAVNIFQYLLGSMYCKVPLIALGLIWAGVALRNRWRKEDYERSLAADEARAAKKNAVSSKVPAIAVEEIPWDMWSDSTSVWNTSSSDAESQVKTMQDSNSPTLGVEPGSAVSGEFKTFVGQMFEAWTTHRDGSSLQSGGDEVVDADGVEWLDE